MSNVAPISGLMSAAPEDGAAEGETPIRPEHRLVRVSIQDTYGTDFCSFEVADVVEIAGANAQGKSSIVRAIESVFAGGHNPEIIRRGAMKSVVKLDLANGTVIVKSTTPKTSNVEITDPNGLPVPAPQSFIKQLSGIKAVSVGKILRIDAETKAGQRELLEHVLSVMPIQFSSAAVSEASRHTLAKARVQGARDTTGEKWIESREEAVLFPPDGATLSLTDLRKRIEQVRLARRKVGQTKEDTAAAVRRLASSIEGVAEDSVDFAALLDAKQRELRELDAVIINEHNSIERDRVAAIHDAEREADKVAAAIDAEIDQKIRLLNEERDRRKGEVQSVLAEERGRISGEARIADSSVDGTFRDRRDAVVEAISKLRSDAEAQVRARTIRDELDVQTSAQLEAAYRYNQLSQVIAQLELLVGNKLADLPVKGLDVTEDGLLTVDGVAWHNVNSARRTDIVSELCVLASGKIGLQLWDDAEHLDGDTRAKLEQRMIKRGYQIIEAIVETGRGLTIRSKSSEV